MDASLKIAIVTGTFTLSAAIVGFLVSVIRDAVNNKNQLRLERLRLHDKDRIEAYKRLFLFARKLANRTFPLADDKKSDFMHLMSKGYVGKLENDYLYFSSGIIKILDEMEERYICMTAPELIDEMDKDEQRSFIENSLFRLAKDLAKQVKKDIQ